MAGYFEGCRDGDDSVRLSECFLRFFSDSSRVWGGGIYENNTFYDICDEMGILVWQDFLFACGNYPAHLKSLRDSIETEAIQNVKRLRHHPSLVIFAGNNEDYAVSTSLLQISHCLKSLVHP